MKVGSWKPLKRRLLSSSLMIPYALLFLLLLIIPSSLTAPTIDEEESEGGCYYMFAHYEEGDRILTNEPCLNCTCHNSMLMCYLRVCPFTKPIGQDCTVEKKPDQCCPTITCPEVPVSLVTPGPGQQLLSTTTAGPLETTAVALPSTRGCEIGGEFYADGAQVASDPDKPCELCYCIRNRTACVMQECILHVEGCEPVFQHGVCCPVRYKCDFPLGIETTTIAGLISTTMATIFKTPPPTSQHAGGCIREGEFYHDGSQIATPGEAPCEHCYCMRSEIVCAVQDCGSPLESEGGDCKAIPPRTGLCCPEKYTCQPSRQDRMFNLETSANETIGVEATTVHPIFSQTPSVIGSTEKEAEPTTVQPSVASEKVGTTVLPSVVSEKVGAKETTEPVESLEAEGTTSKMIVQSLSTERPQEIHETEAVTEPQAVTSPLPGSIEPKEGEDHVTSTESAPSVAAGELEKEAPTTSQPAEKEAPTEASLPDELEKTTVSPQVNEEAVPTTTQASAAPSTENVSSEAPKPITQAPQTVQTVVTSEATESSLADEGQEVTTEYVPESISHPPSTLIPTPEKILSSTTEVVEMEGGTSSALDSENQLAQSTEAGSTEGKLSDETTMKPLTEVEEPKLHAPPQNIMASPAHPAVESMTTEPPTEVPTEAAPAPTPQPLPSLTPIPTVEESTLPSHTEAPEQITNVPEHSTEITREAEGSTQNPSVHDESSSVEPKPSSEIVTESPAEESTPSPSAHVESKPASEVLTESPAEESTPSPSAHEESSSVAPKPSSEVVKESTAEVDSSPTTPRPEANEVSESEESHSKYQTTTEHLLPIITEAVTSLPSVSESVTSQPKYQTTTEHVHSIITEESVTSLPSETSPEHMEQSSEAGTEQPQGVTSPVRETTEETVVITSPKVHHDESAAAGTTLQPEGPETIAAHTSPRPESSEESVGVTSAVPHSTEESVGVTSPAPRVPQESVDVTSPTPHSPDKSVGVTSPAPHSPEESVGVTSPAPHSTEESVGVTSPVPHSPEESVGVTSPAPQSQEESIAVTTQRPELTENVTESSEAPSHAPIHGTEASSTEESSSASDESKLADETQTEEPVSPIESSTESKESKESEELKVASTTVRIEVGESSSPRPEGSVTPLEEGSVTPSGHGPSTEVGEVTTEGVEESTPASTSRIPGEGSCFVEGITYRNGSRIPPSTPCQLACACQNSIVHCLLVHCPAAPHSNGVDKCRAVYKPETCCPTYNCTQEDTSVRPVVTITPEPILDHKPSEFVTITPQAQTTTERLSGGSTEAETEADEKHSDGISTSAEEGQTTLASESSSTSQSSSTHAPPQHILESSTIEPMENKIGQETTQLPESEIKETPQDHTEGGGQSQMANQTEAPPTSAPPSEPAHTSAPPSEAAQTFAPPSEAAHTFAPPSEAPPTVAPPSEAAHTFAPPSEAAHTFAPPSEEPYTFAPPSGEPHTSAPSSEAPPSEAPHTSAPPSPTHEVEVVPGTEVSPSEKEALTHPPHTSSSPSSISEPESTTSEPENRVSGETSSQPTHVEQIPQHDEVPAHVQENVTTTHETVTVVPGSEVDAPVPGSQTAESIAKSPENETITHAPGNETDQHAPGSNATAHEPAVEISTFAPLPALENETSSTPESVAPPSQLMSTPAPHQDEVPESSTHVSVSHGPTTESERNETSSPESIHELNTTSSTLSPENPLYPVTTTTTVTPSPAAWPYPSGSSSTTTSSPPISNGACLFDARVYMSAQQIPRDDPCDFCFCFRGDIICLQQSCPPPIPGCYEEPIPGFCCPRYECPVGSNSTNLPSDPPPSYYHNSQLLGNQTGGVGGQGVSNVGGGGPGCEIQGEYYDAGQLITATSGPCLECRCGIGGIMECDPRECQPEPMLRKMIEAIASR